MKIEKSPSGSILIWTLLLGLSLATVSFFFSQRLNMNSARQRQLMEHQTQTAFLESYANHLESLSPEQLNTIKAEGNIDFEGITGTLSNEVATIEDYLDADEISSLYQFDESIDAVSLFWNSCADNFKTDLTILSNDEEIIHSHNADDSCPADSTGFDDEVLLEINSPFQLKSSQAPFSYRLQSTEAEQLLTDNVWHLNLEMTLDSRKKLQIDRRFVP